MSKVDDTLAAQRSKCMTQIRKDLLKTAEESVFYVALGKAMRRELAEAFGITEDAVQGMMSKAAVDIVDRIRELL